MKTPYGFDEERSPTLLVPPCVLTVVFLTWYLDLGTNWSDLLSLAKLLGKIDGSIAESVGRNVQFREFWERAGESVTQWRARSQNKKYGEGDVTTTLLAR